MPDDMRTSISRVSVSVPATAANLGPGFDTLGLALDRWNTVEVTPVDGQGVTLEIEGTGADELPRDETNLVVRVLLDTLEHLGVRPGGLRVRAINDIPQSGGLGSSASAVIASVAAALALATGRVPNSDEVFAHAARIEGHPDNAAPAVYGGATVAYLDAAGAPAAARIEITADITPVIFVPDYAAATNAIRLLQPDQVPLADAVFNVSRAALLVQALQGAPENLFEATEDRLHQPYRAEAMPATAKLISGLRSRGHAAVLSGAGPTVLVLARDAAEADAVQQYPLDTPGVHWSVHRLPIATQGARVEL